jgi:hypothetical protein
LRLRANQDNSPPSAGKSTRPKLSRTAYLLGTIDLGLWAAFGVATQLDIDGRPGERLLGLLAVAAAIGVAFGISIIRDSQIVSAWKALYYLGRRVERAKIESQSPH